MLRSSEIAFSDEDFSMISKMAAQNYGIDIPTNKKDLLHARIARRMRTLGIFSFQEYMDKVSYRNNADERSNFLTLLTTNTTSFFRERHHFDFLKSNVLPDFKGTFPNSEINIWSAGCSLGQEPYSIAATLEQYRRTDPGFTASIAATDVDDIVLRKAKAGVYEGSETRGLSDEEKTILFGKAIGSTFSITDRIRESIRFDSFNLMDQFNYSKQYDVVFCRNVVIYFARETQLEMWRKFQRVIKPGGYLFLGHSERLAGPTLEIFENVGLTIYRRRNEEVI